MRGVDLLVLQYQLLNVRVSCLFVSFRQQLTQMSVTQDFHKCLLDRAPLFGLFGIGHWNERFYAFHGCITHWRVLVNDALFEVLYDAIDFVSDWPKQGLIHDLFSSGLEVTRQRLEFLKDFVDDKINLLGCEEQICAVDFQLR